MWNVDSIKEYVDGQSWYQKIELSSGIVTPGKFDCKKRLKFLSNVNLKNKTVLDLGCNSGFYCLWAKKNGAKRVVGIDIDETRLAQAKILAEIEKLDVEFYNKNIFELEQIGQFDIVLCFAVLTEIENIIGALKVLKYLVGEKAYVEMALAKPIIFLSRSLFWLKGLIKKDFSAGVLEIRPTKIGWMISPSLKVVKHIIGDEFKVLYLGKGLRYDMMSIERQ